MLNLKEKAIAASVRFLEARDYEVLATEWETADGSGIVDIVAQDEEPLVFIDVTVVEGATGFPDPNATRGEREILAAKWLAENCEEMNVHVRFDSISMMVVGDNKALLRHHVNELSNAPDEE